MRRSLLVLALLGGAACHRGDGATTSVERLERAADRALADGHPHLATLLVHKASGSGDPSPHGWVTAARGAARTGDLGGAHDALVNAVDAGLSSLREVDAAPELAPLERDGWFAWVHQRVEQNAQGVKPAIGTGLPVSSPEAEGIDPKALGALRADAETWHSSAIVVLRHGRLVGQWYFGKDPTSRRIEAMSATKSVVSLATMALIADGKIHSLDEPAADFLTEWRGTPKAAITVGDLLTQTSGLYTRRTTERIYASPDFVKFGLQQPLTSAPGTKWEYNNSACNLVAEVVARAAGEPIDAYLRHRIFAPLGITDVTWSWDRVGHRHGMSGLQIHPIDFAKIGQLMLQRGVWNGVQLLPAALVDDSVAIHFAKEPDYGLLWWRIPRLAYVALTAEDRARFVADGVSPRFVQALWEANADHPDLGALFARLHDRVRPFELRAFLKKERPLLITRKRMEPEAVGFAANGYRGQYLFVEPKAELVVVRMTDDDEHPNEDVEFGTFFQDARRLVEPDLPAAPTPPQLTSQDL